MSAFVQPEAANFVLHCSHNSYDYTFDLVNVIFQLLQTQPFQRNSLMATCLVRYCTNTIYSQTFAFFPRECK